MARLVTTTGVPGRTIALTFDDGPNPPDTTRLLDTLGEHGVTAVFCLLGDQVRRHPEVLERIVADGHVLGNHSMSHEDLEDWSAQQVRDHIESVNAVITDVVPGARIPFFRAPYGHWGRSVQVAAELGMRPLSWSVVVDDWLEPGSDVLVDRLTGCIEPGDVVLLHDGGGDRSGTVDATSRVVVDYIAKGWRFVTPA